MPTGSEAYRVRKELRPVFDHKIASVWYHLCPKVCDLLDDNGIVWTSIDVVRFKTEADPIGPVVLWVGVDAEAVSGEVAHTAADGCLALLQGAGINDVEVEFRNSIYTLSAGPGLLKPVSDLHPTVEATLHAQGTGGLFLAQGGDSSNVLLPTARHVLFLTTEDTNHDYHGPRAGSPPRDVVLMGTKAFDDLLHSIKVKTGVHGTSVELYERQIGTLKKKLAGEDEDEDEDGVDAARKGLEKKLLLLKETVEAIEALEKFHDDVKKDWSSPKQRVIGHVIRAPPITVHAGTEIPVAKFIQMMIPATTPVRTSSIPRTAFSGFRASSRGVMRSPDTIDSAGDKCLFVVKHSITTGVTIGRANGVFSFVREYFPNQTHQTSKAWATLPYDGKSGQFSDHGDSGSIIVDGLGRIGGLLTGGGGKTGLPDVTYATPFFWLLPRIQAAGFPNAHVDPKIA
ncbi:hypothetical protein F5148DRAFT_1371945 [Russula earlei]|uniref:Uncharacterized protein n=1 Tax=Russula earlei TaxID=71964 RepID=A0ACC0TSL5_9AGAM|nr:hypothetical protein F5148DRAFT_1371945 [Russula earlei]